MFKKIIYFVRLIAFFICNLFNHHNKPNRGDNSFSDFTKTNSKF